MDVLKSPTFLPLNDSGLWSFNPPKAIVSKEDLHRDPRSLIMKEGLLGTFQALGAYQDTGCKTFKEAAAAI